jgi:hypothetical protein
MPVGPRFEQDHFSAGSSMPASRVQVKPAQTDDVLGKLFSGAAASPRLDDRIDIAQVAEQVFDILERDHVGAVGGRAASFVSQIRNFNKTPVNPRLYYVGGAIEST